MKETQITFNHIVTTVMTLAIVMTFSFAGLLSAPQAVEANHSPTLEFTTDKQTILIDQVSDFITIELNDAMGQSDLEVGVNDGEISEDGDNDWSSSLNFDVNGNNHSADIYYRNNTSGEFTISATSTNDHQEHAWNLTETHSIEVIDWSDIIDIPFPDFPFPDFPSLYDFPSTNEDNKKTERDGEYGPHVNEVGVDIGEVTLEFVNPQDYLECFEYRVDGQSVDLELTNQDFDHGVAHPVVIGDFVYPQVCLEGEAGEKSPLTHTFSADDKVEVRLAIGAERDWDFDWVTFEVEEGEDNEGNNNNGSTGNSAGGQSLSPKDDSGQGDGQGNPEVLGAATEEDYAALIALLKQLNLSLIEYMSLI